MAITNVGDIYLVTVRGSLNSQLILNTFGYQLAIKDPAFNTTALVAGQINAWWNGGGGQTAALKACLPTNYTAVAYDIQCIRPTRVVRDSFVAGWVGTGPGQSDEQNVAQVIERRGDAANRKNVGTVHLPIPTVGAARVAGVLTAGQLVLLGTFAITMNTPITPGGSTTLLVPVLIGKTPSASPVLVTRVIGQNTVRVMRRRTVGVGK